MIGLKISMPSTCLECPCLHTIIDEVNSIACRFCMAKHKELVVMTVSKTKDDIRWMNFNKPQWCPWVDIN